MQLSYIYFIISTFLYRDPKVLVVKSGRVNTMQINKTSCSLQTLTAIEKCVPSNTENNRCFYGTLKSAGRLCFCICITFLCLVVSVCISCVVKLMNIFNVSLICSCFVDLHVFFLLWVSFDS